MKLQYIGTCSVKTQDSESKASTSTPVARPASEGHRTALLTYGTCTIHELCQSSTPTTVTIMDVGDDDYKGRGEMRVERVLISFKVITAEFLELDVCKKDVGSVTLFLW